MSQQISSEGADARDAIVKALDADGFAVVPGLASDREIASIAQDLEPWFAQTPRCEGDFYGWKTTRIGGLLDKARLVQDLVQHPLILSVVGALLGRACDFYQLNLTQAVRVHPGERAQAPHRDEEMWPAVKESEWLINVMWALDDFSEVNGATRLWPGSHREALDRSIDADKSIAAIMPRGCALIFRGSLTHGAGANISNRARTGLIISYCLGWLKQYENQFLAYPPDVAATFPPALQRLIGYQIHRPNLGGVDGQDPILALEECSASSKARRPHKDALTPEIARELAQLYANSGVSQQ